jgi:DNA polymerase
MRRALLEDINTRHRADTHRDLMRLVRDSEGKFVPGKGSLEPLVVFVGEAPGRTEHRTGQPFVGASGRILDNLLTSVGLPRERCYITNAVHYRPVNAYSQNRAPEPKEVEASLPYLLQEIETLEPLVVVTLGKVPMSALLTTTNSGISACHGMVAVPRITRVPDYPLMTMYHPAVGVYKKDQLPTLRQDFAALARLLRRKGWNGE